MGEHIDDKPFPKGALIAAALLLSVAVGSALTARVTGIGATPLDTGVAVESLSLHFDDMADGSVGVRDAKTGRMVDIMPPGANGFVRVVLRGLAQDRSVHQIGPEQPFTLSRLADGRSLLQDPATGRTITLGAFGYTNEAAFTGLFEKGRDQQSGASNHQTAQTEPVTDPRIGQGPSFDQGKSTP